MTTGTRRMRSYSASVMRDVLLRLQDLTIGELRNKVVHKDAYRPRRSEVENCRTEEIELLYDVKHSLDIRTFEEWQAGSEEF